MAKQTTASLAPAPAPAATRGAPLDPDSARGLAFVLTELYDASPGVWHSHARAQLIHASEGVLNVHVHTGVWLVPPQRAVWIAPRVQHKVSSVGKYWLRSLYLSPRAPQAPQACAVVVVTPLLEELLAVAATFGMAGPQDASGKRLIRVLLDQLPDLPSVPSYLPYPTDSRLLKLVSALQGDPANARSLDALAAASGMTGRTAARLFTAETGLTFGQWRTQLRLMNAVVSLAAGGSVNQVAADVGYEDVSAFIAVYKRAFGHTPGKRKAATGRGQYHRPKDQTD